MTAAASSSAQAPSELAAWLASQPSPEAAWSSCPRADWLLWLALRQPLDDGRRHALATAVALAIGVSPRRGISHRKLRVAVAWGNDDASDFDADADFRATIGALFVAAAITIPLDVFLYFHPDFAGGAFAGLRREALTLPLASVLATVGRFVLRPVVRWRWAAAVRGYSYERAEAELFPRLTDAVLAASDITRSVQAKVFRARLAHQRR